MTDSWKAKVRFIPNLANPTDRGTVSLLLEVPRNYPGVKFNAKYDRFEYAKWFKLDDPQAKAEAQGYADSLAPGMEIDIGWDESRGKKHEFFVHGGNGAHPSGPPGQPSAPSQPRPNGTGPVRTGKREINLESWTRGLRIMTGPIVSAIRAMVDEDGISEDVASRVAISCNIAMERNFSLIMTQPKPSAVAAKETGVVTIDMVKAAAHAVSNMAISEQSKATDLFRSIVLGDVTGYFKRPGEDTQKMMAHVGELLRGGGWSGEDIDIEDVQSLYRIAEAAMLIAYDLATGTDIDQAVSNHAKPVGETSRPLEF